MEYERRLIDDSLDELFEQLPAILLDGPKAVGKTRTASQRAATIKRLDTDSGLLTSKADSEWVTRGTKPILIDEWQKVPSSWTAVKHAVDADYSGSQFLLTGSLADSGTHSGAGRIVSLRMRPMALSERRVVTTEVSFAQVLAGNLVLTPDIETTFGFSDYVLERAQSGFPYIRELTGRAHAAAISGYLERLVDSDLPEIGPNSKRPASILSWMQAYAAATGTTASWKCVRDAASSGHTQIATRAALIPYRDGLTRRRILDELPAWSNARNQFSRVSLASKHYLADPALAVSLLGFSSESLPSMSESELRGLERPLLGKLFESLAVLSIRSIAESQFCRVGHFRAQDGRREIDIVVEKDAGSLLAIEVKLGETVTDRDVRHLDWFGNEIKDRLVDKIVINTGKHCYRRQDGVLVLPLALLGP